MAFRAYLTHHGSTDVVITVDGPVEQFGTATTNPKVVQTVIVQARGKRPTRFRLIWASGSWRAHKAGTKFAP